MLLVQQKLSPFLSRCARIHRGDALYYCLAFANELHVWFINGATTKTACKTASTLNRDAPTQGMQQPRGVEGGGKGGGDDDDGISNDKVAPLIAGLGLRGQEASNGVAPQRKADHQQGKHEEEL